MSSQNFSFEMCELLKEGSSARKRKGFTAENISSSFFVECKFSEGKKFSHQFFSFLLSNTVISKICQDISFINMPNHSNSPTFQISKHMCGKKIQTMQAYTSIHTLIIKSFASNTYICYGTFLKAKFVTPKHQRQSLTDPGSEQIWICNRHKNCMKLLDTFYPSL